MNTNVIQETSRFLLTDRLRFHEAVNRHQCAEVEHVHTDLIGMLEMYYGARGELSCSALGIDNPPHIAPELWLEGVQGAFTELCSGSVDYPLFLKLLMAAGVQSFAVYIAAGRILFMGRNGGYYCEDFGDCSRRPPAYGELLTLVL